MGGLFFSIMSFAQDGLDVDVDLGGDDSSGLFANPLFWVGVGVFILILALIMRGSGKK